MSALKINAVDALAGVGRWTRPARVECSTALQRLSKWKWKKKSEREKEATKPEAQAQAKKKPKKKYDGKGKVDGGGEATGESCFARGRS